MLNIDSLSLLCELLGCEKPKHPLIAVVNFNSIKTLEKFSKASYVQNFYVISMKNGIDCELKYGRQAYDFNEGSLVCTSPGQILESGGDKTQPSEAAEGWMLCIHPELMRGTSLWHKMPGYSFFEYKAHEALHLSESEKAIVERTVANIREEYSANIDTYSKDLIVSNLEVLLNYANRFYGRQFITRTNINKGIVLQFDALLQKRCAPNTLEHQGQPSVKELAGAMGYSPNYLSDMLKKETGKTTQEHIKLQIMALAESLLRTTDEPVYLIADKLGFEQPASFTKFIKAQYGVTPVSLRKQYTGPNSKSG